MCSLEDAPEKKVDPELLQLKGFGPKSAELLRGIGIRSAEQLRARDPFGRYAQLKARDALTSLNLLYAIIGVIEDVHWLDINRTRKTEILLRLEEIGMAPR
jgi:DNA transformation protein